MYLSASLYRFLDNWQTTCAVFVFVICAACAHYLRFARLVYVYSIYDITAAGRAAYKYLNNILHIYTHLSGKHNDRANSRQFIDCVGAQVWWRKVNTINHNLIDRYLVAFHKWCGHNSPIQATGPNPTEIKTSFFFYFQINNRTSTILSPCIYIYTFTHIGGRGLSHI